MSNTQRDVMTDDLWDAGLNPVSATVYATYEGWGSIPERGFNNMIDHVDNYYTERLDDITLLNKAMEIYGQIFVPTGGKRVIGSAYFYHKKQAEDAFQILSSVNGFENLTISLIKKSNNKSWWELNWGEKINNWDDLSKRKRGRLFGYKESILFD